MVRAFKVLVPGLALAGLVFSAAPAVAAPDPASVDNAKIAKVRAQMQSQLSRPGVSEALASFDAASQKDQLRAAEVLLDPVASGKVLGSAMEKMAAMHENSQAIAANSFNLMQYNIDHTVDVGIGPVHWGWFKQSFGWQSNLNTYMCYGNWTGFAGFWNVSTWDNKWSDSTYAHCQTNYDASAVIQGGYLQMHKKLHSWGDSGGWNTFELDNI